MKLPCPRCAGKDEVLANLREDCKKLEYAVLELTDEKEKLAGIGAAGVIRRGKLLKALKEIAMLEDNRYRDIPETKYEQGVREEARRASQIADDALEVDDGKV